MSATRVKSNVKAKFDVTQGTRLDMSARSENAAPRSGVAT